MRRASAGGRISLRVAPAVVTAAAMLLMPAGRQRGTLRRVLSPVVVTGLCATTMGATARRWGCARSGVSGSALAALTFAAESVGVRSGRPFGRYRYTDALQPQVRGVPLVVPLAWVAMALPAREAAHAALGSRSSPATRIGATAVALTAWDLFLDPQMVGEGFWQWQRPGRYRNVAATNFAGWLLVGAAVAAVLELTVPPGEPNGELVAEYAAVAGMNSLGFATVFGDRLVASIGTLGMGSIALAAVVRLVGQRP